MFICNLMLLLKFILHVSTTIDHNVIYTVLKNKVDDCRKFFIKL